MEYTINESKLCKVIDGYLTMKFPDLKVRESESYKSIDIDYDDIVYMSKEGFNPHNPNKDALFVSMTVYLAMIRMFSKENTDNFLKMWFENKYNLNVEWVGLI